MTFTFADLTEWWVALSPEAQATAWQQTQVHSTASQRWSAYLNYLCLHNFLPWFRDNYEVSVESAGETVAPISELVTGVSVTLGNHRLVLIPSEAIDASELVVPQEWVDIPSWTADLYLAVQVAIDQDNPTASHLRVWGYATHQELKRRENYDPEDRTYNLAVEDLSRDLAALPVILQRTATAMRAEVTDLPTLSAAQVDSLIERLENETITFPRLAIPFAQWGALLERPEWRQRLYQRRTGQESVSAASVAQTVTQLGQWLQGQVETGWRSLDTLFNREMVPALRSSGTEMLTQAKRLELSVPVVMLLGLQTEADERVGVRVQIHPDPGMSCVPVGLVLSLLSEAGETLQFVEAGIQDDYIQLRRFRCSTGTRFQLMAQLGEERVVESFVV